MLCVSISEKYIKYGHIVEDSDSYSIEKIGKKESPKELNFSQIVKPAFQQNLGKILQEILGELPLPEKNLAISIPASWVKISINEVEKSLPKEKIPDFLNWRLKTQFGDLYQKKFVQHYPLALEEGETGKYLSFSYFKDLGKILLKTAQPLGLKINLLDVNIFSSLNALTRLYPIEKQEKVGIWRIGPEEGEQEILLVDQGEVSQWAKFEFDDETGYTLLNKSSADHFVEDTLSEISGLKMFSSDDIVSVDKLYVYSNNVESEFFNIILSHNLDNLYNVNPFTDYPPIDSYKEDGESSVAMSQFIDVMGLMFRRMVGDKK